MANSVAVNSINLDQQKQFQGLFSQMWTVKATVTWDAAVAINDTGIYTIAVPGVALGDQVISSGLSMDLADSDGDGAVVTFAVSAANVVSMYVHADVAEFKNDALNGAIAKLLIGRPNW
jgi:hypothetical protein